MPQFLTMLGCLLGGQILQRIDRSHPEHLHVLNRLILRISLPALILAEVPSLFFDRAFSRNLGFAIAMPWLEFIFATALILFLGRRLNWSRPTCGALILTAGLGNTSFIGFPVVNALFGPAGMRIAIVIDQLGTFLILATLGLVAASLCAGRNLRPQEVAKRVLTFPPFLALVFAIAWGLSPLPTKGAGVILLHQIGTTLTPLALISVGWQLRVSGDALRKYAALLTYGLGLKLLLWPALVLVGFRLLLGSKSLVFQVTLIEAAMAPMITGAVVAAEFGLEPELAQLMVGIGIPISIVTVLCWKVALSAL